MAFFSEVVLVLEQRVLALEVLQSRQLTRLRRGWWRRGRALQAAVARVLAPTREYEGVNCERGRDRLNWMPAPDLTRRRRV